MAIQHMNVNFKYLYSIQDKKLHLHTFLRITIANLPDIRQITPDSLISKAVLKNSSDTGINIALATYQCSPFLFLGVW